jgi:uncharacterized alkaline shock family protein YloU
LPDQPSPPGPIGPPSANGRGLASRRALIDIVRAATLGSYGVVGFASGPIDRLLGALEGRPGGLRVAIVDGTIDVRLRLRIAHGLPLAEVARQVESAIRYGIAQATGHEVRGLAIRIAGLEREPGSGPPPPPARAPLGSGDLAESGTDVA